MEGEPPPVEERRRLQQELSEFVESCCRTLEEVTASLGWSLDRLDPGEEGAAEVRAACAQGPFGGSPPAVFSGGGGLRVGAPARLQRCGGRPGPGLVRLVAGGPRVGRAGAAGTTRTRHLCGAPSAELGFEEVKMRWVGRGGRSGVYLENRGVGVLLADVLAVCFVICHMDAAVAPDSASGESLGVQLSLP